MPEPEGSLAADEVLPRNPRSPGLPAGTLLPGLSPSEMRHRHLSASTRGQGVAGVLLSPPPHATGTLRLVLAWSGGARMHLQGLEGCRAMGRGCVPPLASLTWRW